MMMKRYVCLAFCAALISGMAFPAFAGPPAADTGDLKSFLKDKDAFSVTEPKGWTVNTSDANARGMYAYFVIQGRTFENSPCLIYIRILDKMGLSIDEHLKADMNYYTQNKIRVKFDSFRVDKMKYAHKTKKFLIDNKTCEYVCYVDPGGETLSYLIFVLSTDAKHCGEYKTVFLNMLQSFSWGSGQ